MKIFHNTITVVTFLAILVLSGCASYQPRSLNKLTPIIPTTVQEQFISFSYHVFSKEDCLKYLDRDILAKGYQPIHIGIINHSSRSYYLSLTNFSLPCASPIEIAQRVHTSTAKRVVAYGIPGLFIWPFLIPAIIDGVGSAEANKHLDMDFENKSLKDQTINPFSSVDGLIGVNLFKERG